MGNDYLTPEEIAQELKVHKNTVLNWINSGKLKAGRFGPRLFRIRIEDFEDFKRRAFGNSEETKKAP